MRSDRPRSSFWRFVLINAVAACATVAGSAQAQTPDSPPPAPPPGASDPARPPLVPGGDVAPANPAPPPAGSAAGDAGAGSSAAAGGPVAPGAPGTPGSAPSPGGTVGGSPHEVFAEDWWTHTRPVFEIHGYFRTRAELFHNFNLGRADLPNTALWQPPLDYSYTDTSNQVHAVRLCGSSPAEADAKECGNKTQSSANMRFRINPEMHISDNLRIMSQIDMLDNVVLGSTPGGYYNTINQGTLVVGPQNPYVPRAAFTTTTDVPTAGQNSWQNSVSVKRAWGEYMTPVGLLRFGRQPNQWGLGILANAGDGYDADWQSTSDRFMFITGIKSLDLYFAGAWDFPNEGAVSSVPSERQGQPYDLSQLDDVNQYVLVVTRRRAADLAKQDLVQGKAVLNGGIFAVYRNQYLSNDVASSPSSNASLGQGYSQLQEGLNRRNAEVFIPDVWGQILYRKFRFEFEGVAYQGSIENTKDVGSDYTGALNRTGWKVRQYMFATQTELRAIEDRLRIQFGFGWASGDPDVGEGATGISPKGLQLQPQRDFDRTFSMARFHPNYRVDLILFRNILSRVQGAYYFRPSVDYDFARNLNGQKFGGSAAVIWSRASQFVQTPGHKRDLGVELDLTLYYQSKDGSLNDNPEKKGGFYTMLQYGVLFPLGGLGYQQGEKDQAAAQIGLALDTSAAQIIRWYSGVMF
jgi:uncharacterized protein (TIGR04551 family)